MVKLLYVVPESKLAETSAHAVPSVLLCHLIVVGTVEVAAVAVNVVLLPTQIELASG